ncbi:extracellular solute-binding protein [Paenibacillus thermotolerans]|uniref:extracellular solute-binding protein n=1 Tax=Paenibacillus thermotolerans TaxID=3027807 RepID=UPI0023679932|nr:MULTISPECIES: extracellular solute-binding protein [unclassified Paenibacillus]
MRASKLTKSLLSVSLIMSLLLAACSNGGGNESNGNSSGTGQEATDNKGGDNGQADAKDPFGPMPEKTAITIFRSEPENSDAASMGLAEGETIFNNRYTKAILDRLNIEVQFPIVVKGEAAGEKANLMIASNDLTDTMVVGYDQYLQMIEAGQIEDITDEFNDYASQQVKDVLKTDGGKAMQLATVDGKLYGVPTMGTLHNSDPVLWLRKDWLDKVGLPEPKTIDDLAPILKAFIEQDPDGNGQKDTVGLPGFQDFTKETAQMFGFDPFFDHFKSYTRIWVKGDDGTVQYGSIQPQTKDALAKLREFYKQGLVSKEFPIMKSDQAAELVVSNKAGAFFGPWWSGWYPLNDAIRNDPKADWRAYSLLNADGKAAAKQETPIGGISVVRKGYKHPEAMIKLVNFAYQMQLDDPNVAGGDPYAGMPLPNWQTLPVALALWRADSVVLDHTGILAASKGEPLPEGVMGATLENYKTQGEFWAKGIDWLRQNPDHYGEPISRIYGVQPIVDNNVESIYSEFYGTTKTMGRKMTNLYKLEVDSFIKIITGEKDLDYFDEFVKQWKQQGGDEITKEVNDAVN